MGKREKRGDKTEKESGQRGEAGLPSLTGGSQQHRGWGAGSPSPAPAALRACPHTPTPAFFSSWVLAVTPQLDMAGATRSSCGPCGHDGGTDSLAPLPE